LEPSVSYDSKHSCRSRAAVACAKLGGDRAFACVKLSRSGARLVFACVKLGRSGTHGGRKLELGDGNVVIASDRRFRRTDWLADSRICADAPSCCAFCPIAARFWSRERLASSGGQATIDVIFATYIYDFDPAWAQDGIRQAMQQHSVSLALETFPSFVDGWVDGWAARMR
jgi:hypothetical protein